MTKKVVEFPAPTPEELAQIEDEAGDWLIRMDGDEPLSHQEQHDLSEWLLRSPVHKEELSRQAELWGDMNTLTELASSAQARRAARGNARGRASYFLKMPMARWAGAALAVSLISIVSVGVFWGGPSPLMDMNGAYETAVGEQNTIALADGTSVMLNTQTNLLVEYSNDSRDVHLFEGEAHFDVAKDVARPFRVITDQGVFEAVGTAFSIRLDDDAADLFVTEGAVSVAATEVATGPSGASVEGDAQTRPVPARQPRQVVRAGFTSSLARAASDEGDEAALVAATELGVNAIERKLSWREGYLTFSGEPLGEAVEEISRYTTLSLELAEPELAAVRIGGRFPVGETEGILSALEANFGLRVVREGDGRIVLSSAG